LAPLSLRVERDHLPLIEHKEHMEHIGNTFVLSLSSAAITEYYRQANVLKKKIEVYLGHSPGGWEV
jgi:hypothetical protein